MIKTGDRFGRLVIVDYIKGTHTVKRKYVCICDCGRHVKTTASDLKSKNTSSCGCLNRELASKRATRHGHASGGKLSREYIAWRSMTQRCTKPNCDMYKHYGGRGIKIAETWAKNFPKFLEDMGPCPDGMTLERIDVNGNYGPGNCRWATTMEQGANKRNNKMLTMGEKTYHLAEWARVTGLSHGVIHYRLKRGWTVEESLLTPIKRSNQ